MKVHVKKQTLDYHEVQPKKNNIKKYQEKIIILN